MSPTITRRRGRLEDEASFCLFSIISRLSVSGFSFKSVALERGKNQRDPERILGSSLTLESGACPPTGRRGAASRRAAGGWLVCLSINLFPRYLLTVWKIVEIDEVKPAVSKGAN